MPALTPAVIVTVNGVRRRSLGGTTVAGFITGFSTATVRFAHDTPKPDPGDVIEIRLGYLERGQQIVFRGEIDDNGRDFWPRTRAVTASGTLSRMQRGLGVADETADPDPQTLEIPAYAASGETDGQIVTDLCGPTKYGLPVADVQSDTANGGPRTFGNIQPVRLGKNQPAWGLVQDLDRLTFMVTFNAPDGTVRRLSVNGIPSSPALTLTQGQTLLRGSAGETRKGIVNAVTMLGLVDAGGPGTQPSAERKATSRYIPAPPTYVPEEWQTDLAETEAICDLYASRRVGQLNRLQGQTLVRTWGRPDIYPAMSIALDAAAFEYGTGTIFWVAQVQHSWDEKSIYTDLTLNPASLAGGVNPNQPPVPLIRYTLHKEILADGSTVWVLTASGQDSYDPDGGATDLDPQHGIATYLWSGDPVGPATPAGLPIATFVYTSDPTGAQICLTVTDNQLKAATACVTITAQDVARAMTRDLWAAVTSDLLYFAGKLGQWQSTGVAAVGCCEIAHPNYQLAWGALPGGILDKITVDEAGAFAVAADIGPTAVTAASINLGVNGTGTRRCWAGGADGTVWLSVADGEPGTWGQVGTISPPASATDGTIRAIEESPFQSGTVLALCGPTLFRSNDRGATWVAAKTYPDRALNAVRLATGRFADNRQDKSYQWVAFAGTSSDAASRLQEARDQESVDWPLASRPAQPTGLTIGAGHPGLYLTDVGGAGTGRTWALDDFTGGGTLAQRAYDAAYGPPRHIIRDSEFDGTIYGAADDHLFKTDDFFFTTLDLLNLTTTPVGNAAKVGRMVGYGALQATKTPPGDLIVSASSAAAARWVIRRAPTGGWAKLADHPVSNAAASAMVDGFSGVVWRPLIRCRERLFTWLTAWGENSGIVYGSVNAYTSDDWGATWQPLALTAVNWFAVDANGTTLYAVHNATADGPPPAGSLPNRVDAISRSTDNGATWTKMADFPAGSFNGSYTATIACSQDTSGLVILHNGQGYRISRDGGATWGAVFGPSSYLTTPYSGAFARNPQDDALVGWIFQGGNQRLYYTPDGATPGTELLLNPVAEGYVADIRTVGGIVWLADGKLRYSTNGGATVSAPTLPPFTLPGFAPAVDSLADDPGDPAQIFVAGRGSGPGTAGVSYPTYFTYNIDSGEWIDITATHLVDLGAMFYPGPYGMVVRPGGA